MNRLIRLIHREPHMAGSIIWIEGVLLAVLAAYNLSSHGEVTLPLIIFGSITLVSVLLAVYVLLFVKE